MYEKIKALLDKGIIMDWEGIRCELGVPDHGEEFMMFNKAWAQAMSEFVDECYEDEDDGADEFYVGVAPHPADPSLGW